MTHAPGAGDSRRGSFMSEGFREVGRMAARRKLRSAIRQQEAERVVALTVLGRTAWEGKLDLSAHAGIRDRLSGLDARSGELSQVASRLEQEKSALESQRKAGLEAFASRRQAVEAKKKPVDAALGEARSRKSAAEQSVKQAESRRAAIAGKLAGLERDLASLGAAAAPDSAQKVAAAQAERSKLAAEQGELEAGLAASRAQLPGHAAEESRLAAESRQHAAEIAAIDAEQKAAIGRIDTELAKTRSELQGASRQSGEVQKDRDGSFAELGKALYEAGANAGALADPAARVAAIDRVRADAQSALEASLAQTGSLAGGTMAKFWGVVLGVPIALAALGAGTYQYVNRDLPVAAKPRPAAQARTGACDFAQPPQDGKGVGVRSDCLRSEGTFAKGQLKSGRISYPDGRVREGTFADNQQIGMGKMSWRDGRRYEGMFVEGRSMGPGVYVAADGTRDSGMFQPGVRLTGLGTRENPDGSVLVGQFVDGKPSRKMVLVKGGKSEVVEIPEPGAAPGGTARVEPAGP